MRRRITDAYTGLGNPEPEKFDNKYTGNKMFNMNLGLFFCDVLKEIDDLSEFGGFDFKIYLKPDSFVVMFGIEPAYKHDKFICYYLDSNGNCHIKRGRANGYYGSDIKLSTCRVNENCTKRYRKLIDKHLEVLIKTSVSLE